MDIHGHGRRWQSVSTAVFLEREGIGGGVVEAAGAGVKWFTKLLLALDHVFLLGVESRFCFEWSRV